MAKLIENKVIVENKRVRDQLIQKGFGETEDKTIILDLKEALYLLEKKKIEIKHKSKKITAKKLLEIASELEDKFYSNYLVYNDLRERGFVVKTGLKFGFPFRVYPRGKKAGEDHTQWVIEVVTQDEEFKIPELSRMVRLSGNLHTILLFAVVDSENDVNYYEIRRIVPWLFINFFLFLIVTKKGIKIYYV